MQRRAAAVSAAIFLLLAVGAYGLLGMSSQPPVETQQTAELAAGDSVTLGGTQYNVSALEATSGGTATFEWYNASARYTATLANNSTTTFQADAAQTDWNDSGLTYRVLTSAGNDTLSVTLREVQNVSEETFTENGTTYVLVDRDNDGTREAVPIEEYLDEPRTATFTMGDVLDYRNNTTTIVSISSEAVVLEWSAPRTNTREVSNGNNVTLGGVSYIAYFRDTAPASEGPELVVLTQDQAGYERSIERQNYWSDRMRGLWGIVVLGIIGGLGLIGVAYLPSRY
ncbi:MAG: hypothetical protein ABEJ35_06035 [Halobacteriaceae archaeon]